MPAVISSPVDALPTAALIGGRYKLLKALGQGGFGITYIAWDNELARNVAVKECFPAGLCRRDPLSGAVCPYNAAAEGAYLAALDDMRKEAQTLARIEHARVLRVHDVIWGNGSVFLIMPWLSGGSLAERMADPAHRPTEEQHLAWLADVVEGLAYLHDKGIIHRDIKPSNILFDDSGRPVIIDLGAALNRNPAELTRSTTTRGAFSPGYASPEQATGKGKIGPWTDFYSLAATWYELLTGNRPEDAEKRLMEDDMVPLPAAELTVPCPREVRALLHRNLSLRPAMRCRDAADWQQVLRGGALPPLPRRRTAKLLIGLAAVGICAFIFGVVDLFPHSSAPAAAPQTSDIPTARAELRRKMEQHFHIKETVSFYRQYVKRSKEEKKRIVADMRQQFAALQTRIAAAEDMDTLEKLDKELSELNRMKAMDTAYDRFNQELTDYLSSHPTENLASLYPCESAAELPLLPLVAQELEHELFELHNDAMLAGADFLKGNDLSDISAETASLLAKRFMQTDKRGRDKRR